jgi:hypothetical protein
MMTQSIIYGGSAFCETHSIICGGSPKWEGIWENFLLELTQWAYPMPPVDIAVAESKQFGLSEGGVHICVPIFHYHDEKPCNIMQIPIPEVIGMVFFRKFAEFIAHVLNSTTSNYHIRWSGL